MVQLIYIFLFRYFIIGLNIADVHLYKLNVITDEFCIAYPECMQGYAYHLAKVVI